MEKASIHFWLNKNKYWCAVCRTVAGHVCAHVCSAYDKAPNFDLSFAANVTCSHVQRDDWCIRHLMRDWTKYDWTHESRTRYSGHGIWIPNSHLNKYTKIRISSKPPDNKNVLNPLHMWWCEREERKFLNLIGSFLTLFRGIHLTWAIGSSTCDHICYRSFVWPKFVVREDDHLIDRKVIWLGYGLNWGQFKQKKLFSLEIYLDVDV